MILDFRKNGRNDEGVMDLFNRAAGDIRDEFQYLIAHLSKGHEDQVDWWVSSLASRNIFTSNLFHYCCCITVLKDLFGNNHSVSKILIDSKPFVRIVKGILVEYDHECKVEYRGPDKAVMTLIKRIYYGLVEPLKLVLIYVLVNVVCRTQNFSMLKNLVLIDTFVLPRSMGIDRYYPSLLNNTPPALKKKIWFVPTWYDFGLTRFGSVIEHIKTGKQCYLFKEQVLKLIDYVFAWGYLYRILRLRETLSLAYFRGIDISPLAKEELDNLESFPTSFQALLNYKFAKRLKEQEISVRVAVDWFENQEIDKGWNAGFRQYMPTTLCLGYQGCLTTPHYFCMYPTSHEKQNLVLPHKVCVMGEALSNTVKKFCPDLTVKTAPAFRYQHLWHDRKYRPSQDNYTILVSLHIDIRTAVEILATISGVIDQVDDNTRFWIKPHPTTSIKKIKKRYHGKWSEKMTFVSGNFNDLLERADLLLSSASTTCMEALAKGTPVIVLESHVGLDHNPIPETVPRDIWRLCSNAEELIESVKFFSRHAQREAKRYVDIGKEIREAYFEPVTLESVCRFLEFDATDCR